MQRVIISLLICASYLFSADSRSGEELYMEAKCQKCHTSKDYTSPNRKVKDLVKLKWRVKRCDFTMDAGWFEEDIEDVVKYLNDEFYHFK